MRNSLADTWGHEAKKPWTDVTLTELKICFGVVMNMDISEEESVQDYFSRDWIKDQPFSGMSSHVIRADSLDTSC